MLKKIKIFAHTADITEYNILKCKDCGFDKIIEKPILKDKLNLIIKEIKIP